ncbi:signal peptide peptidase SppA [Ohtaekwangia koreensis]|jgi:protease IV|uniref:Protease-4 n=1 Tax=Ohtaekwangia koreensis TaxID=688867 RepID=A0A1T5JZG7_9BACT|nr:signal peptide peptidase SppA [Ohtaekwangia koreensis]SKC56695.1 protease-4 [Ohtaekwangia koreensis]
MNFWKSFFAAFLALILFTVISFILLIGVIGGITAEDEVIVADNSVLHLKLDAQITELQTENPLEGLPFSSEGPKIGLLQLKEVIKHAKDDASIKGIYLEVSYPMAGFSTIEEIRQSLLDFRKSGKWVIAYDEVMSESAYYLASAADKIYLNPEGEVEFNGLTIEISFFKRLFDKLEIKPQIFRVGEFKSAVEPFILEKMSPENRLQLTELANSIYGFTLQRISESRNIPVEKLKEISDKMLVHNAAEAKQFGLVDELLYKDQLTENLKGRLNLSESDDIKFIKYTKYRKSFSSYKSSKNEIAVIVADGTIMPGKADDQQQVIGADTFVEEIRKARTDDDIKAIVIRVNSPGGEFRASDMMWREIQLAKKAKPVIASMGDYAASGGYYMAMGCDTIVAQPHTITGSIGIFGMMFDMSGFLGNKLGITFDEVKTGEFGEMYTVSRPLTEAEKNFWQKNLNDHYDTFTGKAAEGRGISVEEIKKVASGRVWSGAQATERKLVDVLGGFDDAVRIAAEKAGVADDYKIRFYPKHKAFLEQLMTQLEENAKTDAIKSELGESYIWYQQLNKIKNYQGTQARMPFEIQLH